MSTAPPDSDPLPDGHDAGESDDPDLDDLEDLGGTDASGSAASDPEQARQEAEDALAEIEALADLDEDPDVSDDFPSGDPTASEDASSAEPTPDAKASSDPADASSPAAADESESTGTGTLEDQCENCGALLHGPYCSQCGQKAADRIVPIWHMINEALEAVFELDLRVLHTLPKFLFLPGRLTKEYINGRRKRYIRPFRLYLFATFLLFTTLALTTTRGVNFLFPLSSATVPSDTVQTAAADAPRVRALSDSAGFVGIPLDNDSLAAGGGASESSALFGPQAQREKLARQIEEDTSSVTIGLFDNPEANERLERTVRAKLPDAIRNPWDFVGGVIDRGPYLMFIMLPIFAFLLKLLYARRSRLYVEHMIFSLHVHALAFFAFTVGLFLDQSSIGWVNTAAVWIEVSPLLYLILAMSHVYEQGLIKSTIKALVLLFIYSIILSIGFVLLVFLAVLFI
jgi:hypothetical protein